MSDVRKTSLLAWSEVKQGLGKKQKEVLEVIRYNPGVCNQDIAEILGWSINCVTGRCKELRELDRVAELGHKLNTQGRTVMTYAAVPK